MLYIREFNTILHILISYLYYYLYKYYILYYIIYKRRAQIVLVVARSGCFINPGISPIIIFIYYIYIIILNKGNAVISWLCSNLRLILPAAVYYLPFYHNVCFWSYLATKFIIIFNSILKYFKNTIDIDF
jgi:hypothetical protein